MNDSPVRIYALMAKQQSANRAANWHITEGLPDLMQADKGQCRLQQREPTWQTPSQAVPLYPHSHSFCGAS